MGYVVVAQAADGRQAVEEARRTTPDLVLMDIRLGHGPDGVEAADIVRRELELPVVFLTAHSDEATLNRAKVAEPFGYVLKPVRDRELHIAIEMALYKHEAEKVMRESREWFAAILRSVGNAVIANDKHGAISFMNVAAETLTGWREDEARGRPLAEVLRLLRGKDA
jgi:DNA-binding NarL/FixJ family response regulator